ncbi:hypothetical protein BGX34_010442 [Mortierella sp. NVP85]|nr:hypothetical protein BGX34_010442 [Mortierella sp. NVP85]
MSVATLQYSANHFEFADAPKVQELQHQLSIDEKSGSVPPLIRGTPLENRLNSEQVEQIEQLWGEISNPENPAHERCLIL